MLKINKLGMIEGGVCEWLFKTRRKRDKGTKLAVDWLLYNNCIEIKRGWCRITNIPKKLYSFRWPIDNICKIYGGDAEIGWRRFISDIAIPIYKKKTKFRLSKLETWGADAAAREYAVKVAVRRLTGSESSDAIPDGKPHQDALYKDWLKEYGGNSHG